MKPRGNKFLALQNNVLTDRRPKTPGQRQNTLSSAGRCCGARGIDSLAALLHRYAIFSSCVGSCDTGWLLRRRGKTLGATATGGGGLLPGGEPLPNLSPKRRPKPAVICPPFQSRKTTPILIRMSSGCMDFEDFFLDCIRWTSLKQ
jgi:hypothetical protein